jgi:hypothetical protein
LLAAAGPALQRLATTARTPVGTERRGRVKEGLPLRQACDELARLLGGVEFELFISRTKPDVVAAEHLGGPALVLGSRIAGNVLTAAERFCIGRALFLIRENALVLRDRSVRDLRRLFAALGRSASPPCELPIDAPEDAEGSATLDELTGQMVKFLSRKDRKALGRFLSEQAGRFEGLDLGEFARALSHGANRAGLVLAGDANAALEEALREAGGAASPAPELADLLQYLVSKEYLALRVELGLAPGPR